MEKQKNLLDLKYQKYLNYMNMVVILLISSFVTIVIGIKSLHKTNILIPLAIIFLVTLACIILYLEAKLTEILHKIKEL
ncbi:hypothetical protein DRZ77_00875 [Candidatus Woesearchaeota archaeon]|nr:hypothetical protein [Candidatus Woesearchaeota archaeon]RLE40860.1 MAG: hypothetical protein DRZ77_00875 [Candidatus Woesearchaeota archaeon]